MCGIAGLLDLAGKRSAHALEDAARRMAASLAHRGPDGEGVWVDAVAGVALGHRRLAVVDVTSAGAQPMQSADRRWVLCYNGEIYDFEIARQDSAFAGFTWRSGTDTEVLLELVAHRGIEAALQAVDGMFAFALWDRAERTLHLVRDRIGIKPLYFGRDDEGVWRFGSELAALRADGDLGEIDRSALASFLRHGYVPSPWSIYSSLQKVSPGEVVSISAAGVTRRRWWSLESLARPEPAPATAPEAVETLDALLREAVRAQVVADVPLGVFLSGGIDSSLIAAMATRVGGPVRSFSIGFPDLGFDETPHAKAVAAHLGTRHETAEITTAEALALVSGLAERDDEPLADASLLPTLLLARTTRRHVTVALSGDGGDELFAGYNRHVFAARAQSLERLPRALRVAAGSALGAVPSAAYDALGRALSISRAGEKAGKLARVLALDGDALYRQLVSLVAEPSLHVAADEHPVEPPPRALQDGLARMRYADMRGYLADGVLQKVDRASMAASLEVRPPFLDRALVAYAWSLPRDLLVREGVPKWLPRAVLARYLPAGFVERPKAGFSVPLAAWLRGPLRAFGADLIEGASYGGGLLRQEPARRLWRAHQSGRADHAYALWPLITFEAWRRRWAP